MPMSQRRRGSYARAYAFGADSAIVLSGTPAVEIDLDSGESSKMLRRAERYTQPRARERGGVRAWVVVVAVAVLFFTLCMAYLSRCATVSSMNKQLYRIREELARATQTNEALEVRVAEKADDTRIQALALNHLGMKQATSEKIFTVAPVSSPARSADTSVTEVRNPTQTSSSFFDFIGIFLHRIGL